VGEGEILAASRSVVSLVPGNTAEVRGADISGAAVLMLIGVDGWVCRRRICSSEEISSGGSNRDRHS